MADGALPDGFTFIPDAANARAFRDALGCFATGVTLVTIAGPEGPMGFVANSFSSLSMDPPLVIWSPSKSASRYPHFAVAQHYTIHILAEDQHDIIARFMRGGAGFDGLDPEINAEGVPVLLWINAKDSTYGLRVPATELEAGGPATRFTADDTVTLDTPASDTPALSEQDDERLGLTDGLPVIRFTPDGFYDESSVRKIILRQGTSNENALEVVQTANRLGYEIRPASAN